MITILGFNLPKVHLLECRLILIGSINSRLRYSFNSSVRKDDLGRGFLGTVTLTWRIMISTCKSVTRGGEDWGDWRSLQTVQVRRALVPNYTIDGLLPISGQLEERKKIGAAKAMRSARALHEKVTKARH